MAVRVQVILDEREAAEFRQQAKRQSSSLSGWLRQAGRRELERCRSTANLRSRKALVAFFSACDAREEGLEPDWESHKQAILDGQTKERPGDVR